MQLSILIALAATALAGHAKCNDVDCHGSSHKKHEFKKPCLFCPGSCCCKDKYPHGVKPVHCENVYEDIKVRTGCVTEVDCKTSTEVRTQTIAHVATATHILHPEETFTMTRTESYVVWPAQTSFAKDPCHKGCGKPCHKGCCC